jgi:ADP-ribose pyrophosphatase
MPFSVTKHEEIYRGRVFTIIRDEVRHESGYDSVREVVRHDGGAVVAAVFDDLDVLLIRQFRYPIGHVIYELPAGKLNPGEDPAHCASRELTEETGWKARTLERLTSMLTTPGFCSEVLHLFLARGLEEGEQRLEEGEESIEIERVPLRRALAMCVDGSIVDGKTITGLFLAAAKLDVIGMGAA